jgi:hypothetical protein
VGGVVGCAEGALFDCSSSVDVVGGNAVGGVAGEANGTTSRCRNSGVVTATGSAGGVAGYARGALSDCSNRGAVVSVNGESAGGIVAYAESSLYRCFNSGSVEGTIKVGGITADHYGERIDGCVNTGEITGNWAAGIATSAQGLLQNCSNSGQVIGLYAGGIVEDLWSGGVVRNCANNGEVGGFSSAGGLVRYVEEEALLENGVNSGAIMATDNKAGGLAYRNRGVVTNSYWRLTSVEPFNAPAVWTNTSTVASCQSFGEAPGTLGGSTSNRLCTALNAWVSAAWTPGCGLFSWTAGTVTNYPALVPSIQVGGAVISQTLSDRFMAGVASERVDATVTVYTNARPATTAGTFGPLLSQADTLGFTFTELSISDTILDFSPSLAITAFDPAASSLTFTVANGIDATAVLAMNRLAASPAMSFSVCQMTELGGSETPVTPTVHFHADGTAEAAFTPPTLSNKAFYKLKVGLP